MRIVIGRLPPANRSRGAAGAPPPIEPSRRDAPTPAHRMPIIARTRLFGSLCVVLSRRCCGAMIVNADQFQESTPVTKNPAPALRHDSILDDWWDSTRAAERLAPMGARVRQG